MKAGWIEGRLLLAYPASQITLEWIQKLKNSDWEHGTELAINQNIILGPFENVGRDRYARSADTMDSVTTFCCRITASLVFRRGISSTYIL